MFRKIKIKNENRLFRKEKSQNQGFLHKFFFPVREETLLSKEIRFLKKQMTFLENSFTPTNNPL